MVAKLFDVDFYRQSNPDLAAAGLTTTDELTRHFFASGLNEGRAFSRFVDLGFYRASNADLTLAVLPNNQSLYDHLANFGVQEGRKFSPFYSSGFYRQSNADLGFLDNEGLFNHLENNGLQEGRRFSEFLDLGYYAQKNQDLVSLGFNSTQLFDHLRNSGIGEGRSFSPLLNLNFYLDANPDLQSTLGRNLSAAFSNLQISGITQGRRFSRFVNLDSYNILNPDLAVGNLSNSALFNHLSSLGLNEGRRTSLAYNPSFYRSNNTDLQSFDNASLFDHFQSLGFNEGRQTSEAFNADVYLTGNGDLTAAGLNKEGALFHYENSGLREDRRPNNIPIALTGTPGTSLNSAFDLGVFSNRRSGGLSQQISTTNPLDTYRFTLPFVANTEIKIEGLSSSVQASLVFDANGNGIAETEEIALSTQTSTSTTLRTPLAAGTYFLRIEGSGNTNYNLSFTSTTETSINTPRNPGNSDSTALNIGSRLPPARELNYRDFIGTGDRSDYYRLSGIGTVIGVNNFNGELNGELIRDTNRNGIIDGGDTRESITSNAGIDFRLRSSGEYWLRLSSTAPSTNTLYNVRFI